MVFSIHPKMFHEILLLDYCYHVVYFFDIFFNAQVSSHSDIEIPHLVGGSLLKQGI